MVTVNLRNFPENLHYALKIEAAKQRISLKELIIRALWEYLEKKKGE